MKIYKADQLTVTNSSSRKPTEYEVPPFFFKGELEVGSSGKLYPKKDITIVGGYVTAKFVGASTAGLALLKHNIFEKNIVVGTAVLQLNDQKELFVMTDPLLGAVDVTPYDYLTVASFASSQHVDVTCYFTAIERT